MPTAATEIVPQVMGDMGDWSEDLPVELFSDIIWHARKAWCCVFEIISTEIIWGKTSPSYNKCDGTWKKVGKQ